MKIYIFGNQDHPQDNAAFRIVEKIMVDKRIPEEEKKIYDEIEFVVVKPNEDLPFVEEEDVVIVDTMVGISEVQIFGFEDIDKLKLSPRNSVHDFDLGFQLKYLKKLGMLSSIHIIGIPYFGSLDIEKLHKLFKVLIKERT